MKIKRFLKLCFCEVTCHHRCNKIQTINEGKEIVNKLMKICIKE